MTTTAAESTGAPGAPAPEAADAQIVGRTPWQLFWTRFRQDKFALAGLAFIGLLVLVAILAPAFAALTGHGPNDLYQRETTDIFGIPEGPQANFWFGADEAGRDVFVRTIYGTRVSLIVGVAATGIAVFVGVILGVLAGYFGGWADGLISRTTDIILSVPLLLFAIGIVAACSTTKEGCLNGTLKPGLGLVIVIISLFTWPYVARLVRGNTLSLREREFVEASRSLGAGHLRIMFREILPNLLSPIIVYASLLIPGQHPLRGVPLVPGARRPGQHALVGQHDLGLARDLRRGLVALALPRALPALHGAGLQPARRRPARRTRPAVRPVIRPWPAHPLAPQPDQGRGGRFPTTSMEE